MKRLFTYLIVMATAVAFVVASGAGVSAKSRQAHTKKVAAASQNTVGNFAYGQLQASTPGVSGCGTNIDGEPAIHISYDNNLIAGSERGIGGGSDAWHQPNAVGGTGADACAPVYAGQPNAVSGFGASGGDIDIAIASARNAAGTYTDYVSSLNGGSVSVATSQDNGATWSSTPVQAGLPGDDREWIAAFGASTSLLTFHDIYTDNIDVLRSDNGGTAYNQIATAIPPTDYRATNNELGNIVIDRRNTAGTTTGLTAPGFWAYQSFVAPSSSSAPLLGGTYNEAYVSVSNDGGYSWTVKPVPCSVSSKDLDHNFPNVSVDPQGRVWEAWSDDSNVYTAMSADHGNTWTCSGSVSAGTAKAIFPWLAATSNGVDLVYYASPTASGASQVWYVYLTQDLTSTANGWGAPSQLMPVHKGSVCEGGISCTGGRQLFDDFGVDTDQSGWAHIAYSHDAPDLGASGTYTGYAVQTGGTPAGYPN